MAKAASRERGVFVFDAPQPVPSRWNWRESWHCGTESIYSLLAKFAAINALTNFEVCKVFVQPRSSGAVSRFPMVDLRSEIHLNVSALCEILSLSPAQLTSSIVNLQYPRAATAASDTLVWCPRCAREGYHNAACQLPYVLSCPVHHRSLVQACSYCKAPLRYAIGGAANRAALFVCPQCGFDHAPQLRQPHLVMRPPTSAACEYAESLKSLAVLDALPTVVSRVRTMSGAANLPIIYSKPSGGRAHDYERFVTEALASVANRHGQAAQLGLIGINPSARYMRPAVPLRAVSEAAAQDRRDRSPDAKLKQASVIYRSVRRWIARHVLGGHVRCACALQKRLWWDVEGERMPPICPHAVAFVRWRMQWQGCRVPTYLDEPSKSHAYFGVMGWLSKELPVASPLWDSSFEQWTTAHLLALALFRSFDQWFEKAQDALSRKDAVWHMADGATFPGRYWLCSGRGTVIEPGELFVEPRLAPRPQSSTCNRRHRRMLEVMLNQVRR